MGNFNRILAVLGGAALLLSGPGAEAGTSAYSELDLDVCTLLEQEPEFGAALWRCPGVAGYDVFVREGDLRFYLAYAPEGSIPDAHGTTVAPFNRLGPRLEWRLDEQGVPYATIVRYFVDLGPETGAAEGSEAPVLVVSKFENGDSCHISFIDASVNPDANEIARQVADERAAEFWCESDAPDIDGKTGHYLGVR